MQTAAAIAAAAQGLDLAGNNLTILIENTAGAEYSLGASFEQVAEVLEYLRSVVPVAACIDTCHTHVAGYDIVSEPGMRDTLKHLDETIGLKMFECGTATMPKLRGDRSWTVISTSARDRSDWSRFADCLMILVSSTPPLLRKRRSTNREMTPGM